MRITKAPKLVETEQRAVLDYNLLRQAAFDSTVFPILDA